MPISHPDPDARAALRRELRRRRSGIGPEEASACAQRACRHLADAPEFARARRVAGYVAVRGELDPLPALEHALEDGKAVFLPRVVDSRDMAFVRWHSNAPMHTGRYGIPEPAGDAPGTSPEAIDLVVVPLLGFDARGMRLGNGAGYYDRAFAFKNERPRGGPLLAGFAYSVQQCSALEAAPWDVPLDLIVTEQGIMRARPEDTGETE